MKIVFLSFYSGVVNRGVETLVDELCKRLGRKHDVHVFQIGKIDSNKYYQTHHVAIKMKWPEVSSTGFQRRLMIDYYYRKIFNFSLKSIPEIRKIKPDIIFPLNGGWQTVLMKLCAKFCRSKLVVGGQAGLGWDEKWNLKLNPDLYIMPAKRNYKWGKNFVPKQNMEIIPNGVDVKYFGKRPKTTILENLKIKNDIKSPLILCVGGHERSKRIEETIRAVMLLDGYHLLVLGGSNSTKKMGEELMGDRYHQKIVKHNEIKKYYYLADLFTLVSRSSEAFGIAYLEAMACGLPCVATDDELRRGIVGKAGLFVRDPNKSKNYAGILKQAHETDWGDEPIKQAKKYDWDIIAENYDKSFRQLLVS